MGLSEFNFNAVFLIQIKEDDRKVGLSFLKLDPTANWVYRFRKHSSWSLSYVLWLFFKPWPLWPGPSSCLDHLTCILSNTTPPCFVCDSVTWQPSWCFVLAWPPLCPTWLWPNIHHIFPLLHPCRQFHNSRFSHSLIHNYIAPSLKKPDSRGLWKVASPWVVWGLGPCLIYQPGTKVAVVFIC